MDPLSITASASALATFAGRAAFALHAGIEAVKHADQTLLQLQNEVETLSTGLENIADTFASKEIVRIFKSQNGTVLQLVKQMNSVEILLGDCEKTLQNLGSILDGLDKPGPLRGMLRKPIKALKINLATGDIELIRHQLRSYGSALQMTLQLVGICLSVDGNNRVELLGEDLSVQLSALTIQIDELQRKILEESRIIYVEENSHPTVNEYRLHMEHFIQAAGTIFSEASVYAESVAGTVVGGDSEHAGISGRADSYAEQNRTSRERISQWVPGNRVIEEDEEIGFDRQLFKSRIAVARSKLQDRKYQAAVDHFEKCLADPLATNLPAHEIVDLQLELIASYQGAEQPTKQESLLLQLTRLDLPEPQQLHLKHTLALFYAHHFKLKKAREFMQVVVERRLKLLGPQHKSYYDSLDLLVKICKAQVDKDAIDVYENLLPIGYQSENSDQLCFDPADKVVRSAERLDSAGFDLKKFEAGTLNANAYQYFRCLEWAENQQDDDAMKLLLARLVYFEFKRGLRLFCSERLGLNWSRKKMILLATQWGLEDVVRTLLEQGTSANERDHDGRTLLHLSLPYSSIVSLLIKHGAKVNATCPPLGHTPMLEAIVGNHIGGLRELTKANPIYNLAEWPNILALGKASETENLDAVQLLLEAGPKSSWVTHSHIRKMVHSAILCGNTEIVQLLLGTGSSVIEPLHMDSSPLAAAVKSGNLDMLRVLFTHLLNDDPKTLNEDKGEELRRAFIIINFRGPIEVVREFLNAGLNVNGVYRGSEILHLGVRGLIASQKYTTLMVMAFYARDNLMQLLLAKGADTAPRVRWNGADRTALDIFSICKNAGGEENIELQKVYVDNKKSGLSKRFIGSMTPGDIKKSHYDLGI